MSDTTELQIAVQEPASWSRRLSITVPRERVQRTRTSVSSQYASSVRLPGFRKGKTPKNLVERQFGPQIEQETIDRLIQEAYKEALDTRDLHPINQGQVTNVQYEGGADFTFEVEFEVQPAVALQRVSGFTVTRPDTAVGETDVDAVLERIRDDRAHWHDLEGEATPDWNDRVTVEMSDRDAAEDEAKPRPYRFVLGEGQAIPDVEAAILTLSPGAEGDFDARFPDDFPDEAQRGQEQHLHIRLVRAERKHLPELDDELAKALGEFEDVAALRARVLEDLKKDAEQRAVAEVRSQLVQQVVEANPFDVPASMVDRYVEFSTGDTPERRGKRTPAQEEQFSQYRAMMRPQAEAALKRMLVVENLADKQGLRATQDEVDAKVEELAAENGRSPSDVWLELEKSGQLQALESQITEDKVFAYLESQNTVA
ncbi:MAG: Trigger factor [Gemmatimonadetes bacterium]|nr:Trigger factor [Gemmatimonadota bacterium]